MDIAQHVYLILVQPSNDVEAALLKLLREDLEEPDDQRSIP